MGLLRKKKEKSTLHTSADVEMENCSPKEVEISVTYGARAKTVLMALQTETGQYEFESLTETSPGSTYFEASLRRPAGRLAFFFLVDEEFRVCGNFPSCLEAGTELNKIDIPLQDMFKLDCWDGYFQGRNATTSSQYTVSSPSACTAIAMQAVLQMLQISQVLSTDQIKCVLEVGSSIHGKILEHLDENHAEHLTPQEVLEYSQPMAAGMVYIGYLQREISDKFKFVRDLERWVENTAEPLGATLTMRSVTVAIFINRDGSPFFFDSHSEHYMDGKPAGASCFWFRDVAQLQKFLLHRFPKIEGLEGNIMLDLCEINGFALPASKESEPCKAMAKQLFGNAVKFTASSAPSGTLVKLAKNIKEVYGIISMLHDFPDGKLGVDIETKLGGLLSYVFPKLEELGREVDQEPGCTNEHVKTLRKLHQQKQDFLQALQDSPEVVQNCITVCLSKLLQDQDRQLKELEAVQQEQTARRSSVPMESAQDSNEVAPYSGSNGVHQTPTSCCSSMQRPSDPTTGTPEASRDPLPPGTAHSNSAYDPLGLATPRVAQAADSFPLNMETFACPMCLKELRIDHVFAMRSCGHRVCRSCLRRAVEEDIMNTLFPLVCPVCCFYPCKQCPCKTGIALSKGAHRERYCALENKELEFILDKEKMERYMELQKQFVQAVADREEWPKPFPYQNPNCDVCCNSAGTTWPRYSQQQKKPSNEGWMSRSTEKMKRVMRNVAKDCVLPRTEGAELAHCASNLETRAKPQNAGRDTRPWDTDQTKSRCTEGRWGPPADSQQPGRASCPCETKQTQPGGQAGACTQPAECAAAGMEYEQQKADQILHQNVTTTLLQSTKCIQTDEAVSTPPDHASVKTQAEDSTSIQEITPVSRASHSSGELSGHPLPPEALQDMEICNTVGPSEQGFATLIESEFVKVDNTRQPRVTAGMKRPEPRIQSTKPGPQEARQTASPSDRRRKVIEVLKEEKHMKQRLQQPSGAPKIVCTNCSATLLQDVVHIRAVALVHQQVGKEGSSCKQVRIKGFGCPKDRLFHLSIDVQFLKESKVVKCRCGTLVGVLGLYRPQMLRCESCRHPSSVEGEIEFINEGVADSTELCFFHSPCINVGL